MCPEMVPAPTHRRGRSRLRSEVLRLGGQLGWAPGDVITFAEALTGCAWPRCGPAELAAVRAEYETLLQAIQAKQSRPSRVLPPTGRRHPRSGTRAASVGPIRPPGGAP